MKTIGRTGDGSEFSARLRDSHFDVSEGTSRHAAITLFQKWLIALSRAFALTVMMNGARHLVKHGVGVDDDDVGVAKTACTSRPSRSLTTATV